MRIGQALIALVGVADTAAGAALLLAPEWFYETIGTFPPFNRHYAGDTGAFLLPIGLGLLFAAREPRRYGPILVLALGASWLHALNHAYDAVLHAGVGAASLLDVANISGLAVVLSVGAWLTWRTKPEAG